MSKIKNISITMGLLVLLNFYQFTYAQDNVNIFSGKQIYLTNLNNINITNEAAHNKNILKRIIEDKRPKALYIEQWIIEESKDKKLLKKLHKTAHKYGLKLYLVTGKNSWFGTRGVSNTIEVFNKYDEFVDGIVLRTEPNKVNVWKDDISIQVQILNQMLDAYSAIYTEAKKRNKIFIAEFPFWFSDFRGPLKSFSENVCEYVDKVIFLIDNTKKLDELEIKWNDVTCPYNINLTKRANKQTEQSLEETYKKIKAKLTFYSNFNGYIIDSDSSLK